MVPESTSMTVKSMKLGTAIFLERPNLIGVCVGRGGRAGEIDVSEPLP